MAGGSDALLLIIEGYLWDVRITECSLLTICPLPSMAQGNHLLQEFDLALIGLGLQGPCSIEAITLTQGAEVAARLAALVAPRHTRTFHMLDHHGLAGCLCHP
jgi:hypothetical protein